jgi:DNA-binding PadR family transcriptional regulator
VPEKIERDLTTLEYVVLGLIGVEPQSGYSIITMMESGVHRWSASPGSIYPMLKRLERQGIIMGELDIVYETRPRKIYRLTSTGEALLDGWLRSPVLPASLLEERDVALLKFLFMEKRLSHEEVIAWLDTYEQAIDSYDLARRTFYDMAIQQSSIHQQLILEATMMDLNTQRTWVQIARRRLKNRPPRPASNA